MEPFVRAIVAGGIVMVAGLWILEGLAQAASVWILGLVLVVVGGGLLLYGIYEPLEY